MLIDGGANLNIKNNNETALSLAVEKGIPVIVE